MRLNKKGFTLVELLAVIVILAVVMLIAVTSVGPMMAKSRKSALGTEGLALIDAAKTAYSAEALKNSNNATFKQTDDVCFSLESLYQAGYFEKNKNNDGYEGSVLVDNTNGTYSYTFWITNGTYYIVNGTEQNSGDVEDDNVFLESGTANTNCGNFSGAVKIASYSGGKFVEAS